MPLKVIVWGLPLALSVMLTDALRAPAAVGVNVTLIEQLAAAATLDPQVFVCAKSPEFVPVRVVFVMLRVAVPLLVRVTLCAELVVPIFCEVKVRLLDERLTAGVGVGVGLPPPPPLPPQATHTPATVSIVANNNVAGLRLIVAEPRSVARTSIPANSPRNPAGKRKFGGTPRCRAGGALAEPVVVIVSTSVTAEAPLTVTAGDANVQLAPVGQPLATLRLTVPVNPFCGLTLMVEAPGWPGAEITKGEGLADTEKSPTAMLAALEVEGA